MQFLFYTIIRKPLLYILVFLFSGIIRAQYYGDFPSIPKQKLLNDLELLYQGLDKFHTGMYWYTPKDSVDVAFEQAKKQINKDMNVMEFFKIMAPLVGLSREDHTNIYLPGAARSQLNKETGYFPFTVVFLGTDLYCVKNGSQYQAFPLEGKRITSINGESPVDIVKKIGSLFASDGYIKTVKYSDLSGFNFARYYYYYYGQQESFAVQLEGQATPIEISGATPKQISNILKVKYGEQASTGPADVLEFKVLNPTTAYLGIHTFSNDDIREQSKKGPLSDFLKKSFETIAQGGIQTLVVDVSQNTGGSEGNEGLLYSYFGDNYQKYKKVRAKTQKAVLDNQVDRPITLKTFGFFERTFANRQMEDGSLERKESFGKGLMAYKNEPSFKFPGKTYVIIGPLTYSGGSEFSNMMYSQGLATFVGQETGGGYLGNTSGYSEELVLPNSKIGIYIPALQFMMNVAPKLPKGRGVIPDHTVVPTFDQYQSGENAALKYILETLEKN